MFFWKLSMKKQEGLKYQEIKKAAQIIKNGGIVIFPTDTVYGIGCRFDDIDAVNKLYRIKNTPENQPFPILVSGIDQVKKIAKISEIANDLIHRHWPGGLTIILPAKNDSKKIGFRMPKSKLLLLIIKKVGVPIIGTSANFHGANTSAKFEDLDPKLIKLADYVIKGECLGKVESTVVDATVAPPKILRRGVVNLNDFKN